jgi:hypothetical protein
MRQIERWNAGGGHLGIECTEGPKLRDVQWYEEGKSFLSAAVG